MIARNSNVGSLVISNSHFTIVFATHVKRYYPCSQETHRLEEYLWKPNVRACKVYKLFQEGLRREFMFEMEFEKWVEIYMKRKVHCFWKAKSSNGSGEGLKENRK